MLTIILLATAALTFAAAFMISRRFDREHRPTRVHCDTKQGDFEVDVLVRPNAWNFGDHQEVVACTAFDDPKHVTCDKHCLEPLVQLHAAHHT